MKKTNELNDVRKLATIAKILDVKPIEGADNIEKIFVRGWQCVAKKGEFQPEDLCVYVEVDSIMPDGLSEEKREEWHALNKQMSKVSEEERNELRAKMTDIVKENTRPEFEFLRDKKFHIKTRRIFSCISQGICFPLSILERVGNLQPVLCEPEYDVLLVLNNSDEAIPVTENEDVTDVLGVTQYIPPDPAVMGGDAKGELQDVGFLVSDEERLENLNAKYEEMRKFRYFKTEKLDGCLDENTILETEDGFKTIKEICETKYTGKIKSFDVENEQIIYTKITNHFINQNETKKKWFEIELEDGTKLLLTENHRVWIPSLNCWRRADELSGEEDLLIN